MRPLFRVFLTLLATTGHALAQAAPPAQESVPLVLDTKIPLGSVEGRIDHLAVDVARQRLFIAELGNDSLAIIDLKVRSLTRIAGLKEPQGVGYVPSTDALYVANAGDGTVRVFRGDDFAPAGRIDLKDDADNIRVDTDKNQVFIGYGSGAIAIIDPSTLVRMADLPLKAHPESFQLSDTTGQIFVNLPSVRSISVLDRLTGRERASWSTGSAGGNYPMALDDAAKRVLVAFRDPPRLAVFTMTGGELLAERDTCGDSDDLFFDVKRKRAYVICGAGFIDVFDASSGAYQRIARIPTASGARTGLFIPALDLLAVALRASGKEPAALWLYRVMP